MSSVNEVSVINVRNRDILRLIKESTFFNKYEELNDPLSALRFLSADKIPGVEYIKVWWKDKKTPIRIEITSEGSMLLEASDAFYGFLKKNKFRIDNDSHKSLLTSDKKDTLKILRLAKKSFEDLRTALAEIWDYTDDLSDLIALLENQKYIQFDPENEIYFLTRKGLIALEATDVFYGRLTELGFFEENKHENTVKGRVENVYEDPRVVFAEFDGGESWRERNSGAAE